MKPSLAMIAVLLACVLAHAQAPDAELVRAENERIAAIASACKTFVAVFANEGNGGGSGVVISPEGFALTNFHVAKPAGAHMKCGMNDGKMYDAVIVGLDPTGDIALIKLLGRNDFPTAKLADSDALRVGEAAFAVGNPFLLATDLQPTVTYGIVSGVHRCQYPAGTLLEYTDAVQTDASINPGNSGGPLFNARGELIGIVGSGSFDKRGRVNVGVGYAISINQVKNFLGSLHSGRLVDHATLGATVSTDEKGRVFVDNILDASDAFRRGLRYGDEIVAFGGRRITSANGFKSVLGTFPKGWSVPLTYRRDGKEHKITVRLAGLLSPEALNTKATQAFKDEEPPPGKKPPDKKSPPEKKPEESPHGEKQATPSDIAAMIDVRTGFANRYFNRLHRDRVWKGLMGTEAPPRSEWSLEGSLSSGEKISAKLDDEFSEGGFPSGLVKIEADKDLDRQTGPPGSGGLVAALHLWRKLLVEGPGKFGDVVYEGTRPQTLSGSQFDILVAVSGTAQLEAWLDRQSGRLIRLDYFVDEDVDPCTLRFDADDAVKHPWQPKRIEAWHGDRLFAEFLAPTWTVPTEKKP